MMFPRANAVMEAWQCADNYIVDNGQRDSNTLQEVLDPMGHDN